MKSRATTFYLPSGKVHKQASVRQYGSAIDYQYCQKDRNQSMGV